MINIYQVLPRLFGNEKRTIPNGTIEENGCGKLNDFTGNVLKSIKSLGITHIWYTGVIEHATQTDYSAFGIAKDNPAIVKGKAGSAYAIKDYYDIDPDLAVDVPNRMAEFEQLIERTHKADLKAIIDFVPNHVARQYKSDAKPKRSKDLGADDHDDWAFSPHNNFYYLPQEFSPQFDKGNYYEFPARATGNDGFTASPTINDWYETVKLNYGVDYMGGGSKHFDPIPDTWHKMLDILLFWAKKKTDGFRCDMAEMVPVEFWAWVIPQVKKKFPHIIFIAEVYNPSEYRNYIFNGKFDYLYDKVGLYDTLRGVICSYASAAALTQCWQAVNDIRSNMLNFLENHDEQRIASDFFAGNASKAIPAMIFDACFSASPLMIYSGQELGERGMDAEGFSGKDGRTTIFDYWSVDSVRHWYNAGKCNSEKLSAEEKYLQDFYKKLLNLRLTEKAVSDGLTYDLMWNNYDNQYFNSDKHFAFFRKYENETLLVILNFSDMEANIGVKISEHAFDYLNLPKYKKIKATDLLSGKQIRQNLSADQLFFVTVSAERGIILNIEE